MEHYYNVIWADDEVDILLEGISDLFQRNGINIIPFSSAKPAIEHIRKNPHFIDAIIVDAKFPRDGEAVQEEGKSFPGLSLFMHELSSLRNEFKMPYPCWIFTGYGSQLREKYDLDDLAGFEEDIISKGDNRYALKEWIESMCEKISETRSSAFKLRQDNFKLFELCSDSYLGQDCAKTLYSILEWNKENELVIFNSFRSLLERLLEMLVREEIIDNLTAQISVGSRIDKFENAYRKRIPQYIIPSLKLLLVSSPLSHPDSQETKDVRDGLAPFMYETLLNTLKNILPWFKNFVDEERMIRESRKIIQAAQSQTSVELQTLSQSIEADESQEGCLTPTSWSVNLGGRKYAKIGKDIKLEPTWRQGTKLRVITEVNDKGQLVVKKIIGLVK